MVLVILECAGGDGAVSEGQKPSLDSAQPGGCSAQAEWSEPEGATIGAPKASPLLQVGKKINLVGFLLATQEQVLDPRPREDRQVTPRRMSR